MDVRWTTGHCRKFEIDVVHSAVGIANIQALVATDPEAAVFGCAQTKNEFRTKAFGIGRVVTPRFFATVRVDRTQSPILPNPNRSISRFSQGEHVI